MHTKPIHGPLNKSCLPGWADAFPAPLFYEHRQGERMNETTIKLDTQIWPLHIRLGLEAPAASDEEGWDWKGQLLPPHSQKSPGLCGESLVHNGGSLHGQHRDGGRRLGRDGCREGADLTRTCGKRQYAKIKKLLPQDVPFERILLLTYTSLHPPCFKLKY